MESSDPWVDFEQIRHTVKNNTVDKLKQILAGFNEECATHYSKSGKKQEIIDRITSTLDAWRQTGNKEKWLKAKSVLYQVRNTGIFVSSRSTVNQTIPLPPVTKPFNTTSGTFPSVGSAPTRYDPFAPPRKLPAPSTSAGQTSTAPKPPVITFKESPFFRVDQAVSPVVECPESTSATDRRQQTVTFTLNNDQINKLKSASPTYHLRLFCTSSIFYSNSNAFRANNIPCPIEFPPTCEVRVNNVQLSANLKGLKKKPGTAPPPDLGKYTRLTNLQNRVEMVYVNSQQPAQSKKYYLIVMLVEVTSIDGLIRNLKTSCYRSSADIKRRIIESLTEDDDIVAGPQKMSLKCPLSFMRVNIPCRSSKCVHSQCFDATSWFAVMEQTTTWLCPVCEKTLDPKDLIIDGYFDEILKETPESEEDVIVEADGEWHTSDNKYGSPDWKAEHPVATSSSPARPKPIPPPQAPRSQASSPAQVSNEIFVLDSDDEDEGRVKRELSPSHARSSLSGRPSLETNSLNSVPQTHASQDDAVIDLTLDSDDEGPPPPKTNGKRRASEAELLLNSPTEPIWKKGRVDAVAPPAITRSLPVTTNAIEHPSLPSLPPTSPSRFPVLPPIFSGFPARSNGVNSLPPPPRSTGNPFISRLPGSSWRP